MATKMLHRGNRHVQILLLGLVVASALLYATICNAKVFPERTVEIIVAFPPGGSADFLTRLVAEKLSGRWKVPVVVQNRPGAAGQIGYAAVAKAAPDGYTLGFVGASFMHLPALRRSMPYDVLKDFEFVTAAAEMPFVLTVTSKLPVRSFPELVEYSTKHPGALNYGSFGLGTSPHLLGVFLTQLTPIKAIHVPFKGSQQTIPAQLSGEIQLNFDVPLPPMPHIKAQTLRPLLVTSKSRYKDLPDTPTAAELGLPKLEFSTWFGFMAPKGLSPDVMKALDAAIVSVLRNLEVISMLEKQGMVIRTRSLGDFRAFVTEYKATVEEIVRDAGIPKND